MLDGISAQDFPNLDSMQAMPGFADKLSDQQAADVAIYLRAAWGGRKPDVTAADVHALRRPAPKPRCINPVASGACRVFCSGNEAAGQGEETMRTLILAAALCLPAAAAFASGFAVTSPDIPDGGTVPMVHVFNSDGCTGGDKSPAISWSGAPAGTKSFAVTIYDPDAPTGSGWWHWTVFNVPPTVHSLPENAGAADSKLLPKGAIQGRTDFGFSHYGGPCPPVGDPPHHYQITVFAVKTATLPLNAQASGALVGFLLHFNTLGTARTTGLYGRPH